MTIEEIQNRIARIKSVADDDETAHIEEDALRADFIKYVATLENESLAAKARLVLSSEEILFSRWCA